MLLKLKLGNPKNPYYPYIKQSNNTYKKIDNKKQLNKPNKTSILTCKT